MFGLMLFWHQLLFFPLGNMLLTVSEKYIKLIFRVLAQSAIQTNQQRCVPTSRAGL